MPTQVFQVVVRLGTVCQVDDVDVDVLVELEEVVDVVEVVVVDVGTVGATSQRFARIALPDVVKFQPITFLLPYLLLFGGLSGAGMMSPQLVASALHSPPAAEPRAFDCRKWSRS